MDEVKAGIQYVFQTKNKMTLALSSTGHSGMECVMTNLIEKGDKVLIANTGIWGERAMEMARRQGIFISTIFPIIQLFSWNSFVLSKTKKSSILSLSKLKSLNLTKVIGIISFP